MVFLNAQKLICPPRWLQGVNGKDFWKGSRVQRMVREDTA